MTSRHRLTSLFGAIALVGLAACGSPSSTSSPATQAATGAIGAPAPAESTPQALQFSAPLLGGQQFDGASYTGHTLAFWFWAPT